MLAMLVGDLGVPLGPCAGTMMQTLFLFSPLAEQSRP